MGQSRWWHWSTCTMKKNMHCPSTKGFAFNKQVEESGMEVLKKEEKLLTKEEAAEFYKQHEGSEHFDQLVEFMSR